VGRAVNYMAILAGVPETGKSSLVATQARAWLEAGEWVFFHDPNGQFTMPQFGSLSVRYENAAAWRAAAAAAAKGGAPMPRAASVGGASDELVALVDELGKRHNTQFRTRLPMRLVVDEASLMSKSGATHMDRADNELISNRRHRGVGISINTQRVKQLPAPFYQTATDVFAFRGLPRSAIDHLVEMLNIRDASTMEELDAEPSHEFLHIKPGRGVVAPGAADCAGLDPIRRTQRARDE